VFHAGLIWDKCTAHSGPDLDEWVENYNRQDGPGRLIIGYIPEGMTSLMQVCDVVVNRRFKQELSARYHDYRMVKTAAMEPGQTLKVPRDQFISFLEGAVATINRENQTTRTIADAFESCGQNPWAPSTKFDEHLAKLSNSSVYRTLSMARDKITLDVAKNNITLDDAVLGDD
jgi:hypothetical protein